MRAWQRYATHPHAIYYLLSLAFVEAIIMPVPPDVILAPMVLAKRAAAWRYAALTVIASVLGGCVGYALGLLLIHAILPLLQEWGYLAIYQEALKWFNKWGAWTLIFAGFTPIPYKIFTVAAGALQLAFWPFLLASVVGRSLRFFLLAAMCVWGGEKWQKRFSRSS